MSWQRVGENTYIDDTLVTCAEYQLFIDEMREQGKYRQPDHWITYQFLGGKAREAVSGVRHSDAIDFCIWLSQREGSEWNFRLPTHMEAVDLPIAFHEKKPLCYWIDKDFQVAWIGPNPQNNIDFARALTPQTRSDNIRILTIARTMDRNPVLDLNLDCEHIEFLTHSFERLSSRNIGAPNFDFDVLHRARKDLEELFDNFNKLILNRTGAKHHVHSLAMINPVRFDVLRLAELLEYIEIYTINGSGEFLYCAIDIYIDLFTLQERIAGRSTAFEGIRLVKERK